MKHSNFKNIKKNEHKSQNYQIIPKRVTIETIYGCNATCIMCPISLPTKRKKGQMDMGLFKKILKDLEPYQDNMEMMDFFGLGEPLLDPFIFERIKIAKDMGFRGLGISTNADLLNEEKQNKLINSGLNNVIFSIDGFKKQTHETIRVGTNYEKVRDNTISFIKKRNKTDTGPKIVVRFIKQEANKKEWEEYKSFWKEKLDSSRGDILICYNMHTHGGEIGGKSDLLADKQLRKSLEISPCEVISNILYILNDGTVPLCSEDWYKGQFNFGNATDTNVLEIYNSKKYQRIRKIHENGKKSTIPKCRECTVAYSALQRNDY
jgi:MoaA/NifB/PqqE/SkfB family radical SAM enzyme